MTKQPTRLPRLTTLAVEFAGKRYPAWIQRWTRHVFTVAGPIAKTAALKICVARPRIRQMDFAVRRKLERWGYQSLFLLQGVSP